jgi:anti-sigma B factor antagonist
VVERRKSLVVRSIGNVVVAYFVDSKILEEMQIKWLGNDLYDLVDKQHKERIIINFQNVQRFSTALLGKLIGLKKKTAEVNGTVKLCCIPPNIMEIFRVTGLDAAFEIFDDETAAIKSFGKIGA